MIKFPKLRLRIPNRYYHYALTTLVFVYVAMIFWPGENVNFYTVCAQPPIVVYHHIVEENSLPAGTKNITTAKKLEEDLRALTVAGYTPVFLRDVLNSYKHGLPLPRKPVVIQFDDGYESVYTLAMPILEKLGLVAEVYPVVSFIGRKDGFQYLDWEQLRAMQDSGLFIVGCHGLTHDRATDRDPAQFAADVSYARSQLIRNLGPYSAQIYSYPSGDFNGATLEAVRNIGFSSQLVLNWGIKRSMREYDFFVRRSIDYDDDILQVIMRSNWRLTWLFMRPS